MINKIRSNPQTKQNQNQVAELERQRKAERKRAWEENNFWDLLAEGFEEEVKQVEEDYVMCFERDEYEAEGWIIGDEAFGL